MKDTAITKFTCTYILELELEIIMIMEYKVTNKREKKLN